MREIKFRFWSKQKNKMSDSFDLFGIYAGRDEAEAGGMPFYEDQIILMQYTGLKDSKGVEIYEGDIVRDVYFSDAVDKVEWAENSSHFNPFFREDTLHFCDIKTIEVIGNVWENPELLK